MNTADVVSLAVAGSAVLLSGTAWAGIRSAVRSGYTVTVTGPSVRFEPYRIPAHGAAEAVTVRVPHGETMTRREAAVLLGIGEREVRALGKSGVLAEIRQGGRATLVTADSVRQMQTARSTP